MAQQKQKELALDLSGYVDKTIKAKLHGGREVSGVLKGYDQVISRGSSAGYASLVALCASLMMERWGRHRVLPGPADAQPRRGRDSRVS